MDQKKSDIPIDLLNKLDLLDLYTLKTLFYRGEESPREKYRRNWERIFKKKTK
jgi:hypothetical protein